MWLTVLLVIERYMAICHPLKTEQRYNAAFACICVVVTATLFNGKFIPCKQRIDCYFVVPTILELCLVPCIDVAHENATVWKISMSELRTNETYK